VVDYVVNIFWVVVYFVEMWPFYGCITASIV